ncbi:MAG: amidohydrolase family protein [Lentisphaeria bacterium]|nr:amidohydrolase family protein [Lentisphaeria bacterium]
MFIDCHVHVIAEETCPRPDGKQPVSTPEVLLERYAGLGIEKAVLLPTCTPDSCGLVQSNDDILRIVKCYPDRFIPFCNVDPRGMRNTPAAEFRHILEYYRDKGCKGVGEVTANLPLDDPRVENLFRQVEAAGLALTFHLAVREGGVYGLIEEPGLKKLEKALQKFPKLKFFGHSQTFWSEMAADLPESERGRYPKGAILEEGAVPRLLRKYPNLYGDLSAGSGWNALARDEEYAVKFLNEFQDRLMFGTDICAPDTEVPHVEFLTRLKDSGRISESVFCKVARENIVKILDL